VPPFGWEWLGTAAGVAALLSAAAGVVIASVAFFLGLRWFIHPNPRDPQDVTLERKAGEEDQWRT
jgi:hypothetical protein